MTKTTVPHKSINGCPVFKIGRLARHEAMQMALRPTGISVSDTKAEDWIIRDVIGECECGETMGAQAIFMHGGEQHEGFALICEECGR